MAVQGDPLATPYTLDEPVAINGVLSTVVNAFSTEGTYTESTVGQIWPR